MMRQGRCRCGSVLRFEKGPNGYKTRCPSCGSVVRLQPAAARDKPRPQRSITCPCGAAVVVSKGMTKASCPACQRELLVTKKSSRSSRTADSIQPSPSPQGLPDSVDRAAPHSALARSSPSHPVPAAQSSRDAPRTVTCEVCQKVISAQAARCPGCGASLERTTAISSLQPHGSASSTEVVVRKPIPRKLILGWAAAGTGLTGLIALTLWLLH
jgi:ssDNA-binding Zn-finger/Zn-ribbon topoisomerase 1